MPQNEKKRMNAQRSGSEMEQTPAAATAAETGATPKLRELFREDWLVGAAVNRDTIVSHADLLDVHFNSVTPENEMKFASLHPAENVYAFDDADAIVRFARERGMNVRGHTLVWHNQTPDWVFSEDGDPDRPADRDTLLARMKAHIDTVVRRYRGDVYAWDVVNEAVADEGPDVLRDTKWLRIAGEAYIAKAFEYAHEADPDALLFYNDYNECQPAKREKIYGLVRSLLERGVPVHGIGMQAHWNLFTPAPDDIRAAIERYASLGVQVQITEMDVSVYGHEDRRTDLREPTGEMLRLQEERYRQFFAVFREYRDVISGVTFWGVADDRTWLDHFPVRSRKNWPLLFDTRHRPKAAFRAVAELARPKP
jgi:endo-1,4-beta-xylanase